MLPNLARTPLTCLECAPARVHMCVHAQEASPANIAPWARAELVFSQEFEEFNDYILQNADRLVKDMPKEVRALVWVVYNHKPTSTTHTHTLMRFQILTRTSRTRAGR